MVLFLTRHRDESTSYSDRRVPGEGGGSLAESRAGFEGRAELEGASANNSPTSSHNTSPRTSLYLSDPPSSMEGLISASCAVRKGTNIFFMLIFLLACTYVAGYQSWKCDANIAENFYIM